MRSFDLSDEMNRSLTEATPNQSLQRTGGVAPVRTVILRPSTHRLHGDVCALASPLNSAIMQRKPSNVMLAHISINF